MESTYVLTLVNDHAFYYSTITNDYTGCLLAASNLYDSHHAEDGLTITERLEAITEAIKYTTED